MTATIASPAPTPLPGGDRRETLTGIGCGKQRPLRAKGDDDYLGAAALSWR